MLLCLANNSWAAVTPTCPTLGPGLLQTTYDTTGYVSSPGSAAEFQTIITTFGTDVLRFGTGTVTNINGSGNPFGNQEDYLNVPADGFYELGINGDDAVELLINGNVVSGWYGGHGAFAGGSQPNPAFNTTLALEAGYHLLEFRMEEVGGGDNYFLFWRKPADTNFSIVGSSNPDELQHCPRNVFLSLQKNVTVIDDPVNGTTLPKSIPGATAIYTLDITNSGNRSPDANSLIISDGIPSNVELFVDNYDGTGQSVKFTDTNNSGLTLNASGIRYSAIGDPSCSDNYTPVSTGGYDANVNYLCITPDGVMNFDELTASGFQLEFQTRVK